MRDVFVVGTATWSILRVALILVAALFLRRRGRSLLEGARSALLRQGQGVRWTRRVETLFGAIQAVAPWSLFLVVLVPAAWEVYAQDWEAVLKRIPAMRDASLNLERPSKRLTAFLTANDVPFVNLLPEFRSAASDSPPLYVKNDAHWTFEGHRLATKLLAEKLEGMLNRTAGEISAK